MFISRFRNSPAYTVIIKALHWAPVRTARNRKAGTSRKGVSSRAPIQREICSYFCKAVRALWNGGKNGPVQEHQKDATVPGAPAYRAFFIWRKAQPCSG